MRTPTAKAPSRKKDLPATVGFVEKVRDELKADIRALDHKMASRFHDVDARFSQIDARFSQMDARFDQQDEKIEKILSSVHRMEALMEQQHAENRIVLEKLAGLSDRQDRLEIRQDEADRFLRSLATSKKQ